MLLKALDRQNEVSLSETKALLGKITLVSWNHSISDILAHLPLGWGSLSYI